MARRNTKLRPTKHQPARAVKKEPKTRWGDPLVLSTPTKKKKQKQQSLVVAAAAVVAASPRNNNNNNKKNKKNKFKNNPVEKLLPIPKKKKETKKKPTKTAAGKKQVTQQQHQSTTLQQQHQQQIQLPPKRTGQGRIPWMSTTTTTTTPSHEIIDLTVNDEKDNNTSSQLLPTTNNDNNSKKRTGGIRLPTDDSDTILMERFSRELQAFASYVRLTDTEHQARQALLEKMHGVAVRMFGNAPEINAQELELAVFGSFACPAVCTFQSDVDVALWGAVYPKKKKQAPKLKDKFKVSGNTSRSSSSSSSNTAATTTTLPSLVPHAKVARKQKWLTAMMDEENGMTPATGAATAALENSSTAVGVGKTPNGDDGGQTNYNISSANEMIEDQDDMPLFVLDRTGVEHDLEESSDKSAETNKVPSQSSAQSTSVSTRATVTEESSESSSLEDDTAKTISTNVEDGSDDDTADKLTESRLRGTAMAVAQAASVRTSDEPNMRAVVSQSGSDSGNEQPGESGGDGDMAVHIVHRATIADAVSNMNTEASDFSRRKVIDSLQRYYKGLRNSGIAQKIQLISRARVPIIKMESDLGVEVDCSIGGMNGADTSLYAFKMSEKYKSFGPVVVALKVIMNQQNLDIPFNGGLGSYKLYVLVASHIAKHVELGGRDDPSEIFLSFLFRYGESVGHHHTHRETRTFISKDDVISCIDGGNADLSNVFLIKDCRSLFGSLWKRLWSCLRKTGNPAASDSPRVSFLAEVIHTTWLDHNRQMNISNAQDFLKKQSYKEAPRKKQKRQGPPPAAMSAGRLQRDLTDKELVASYVGRPAKKMKTGA